MKSGSTLFLKSTVAFIGLGSLGIVIYMLASIRPAAAGPYYPVVLLIALGVVPFLIALGEAFKLLIYIDKGTAFSELSVRALRNIKGCAIAIAALFAAGMPYIHRAAEIDDAPGVILLGLMIVAASAVIAVFAAVLQKLVRTAIEIKSENELTV